MYDIHYAVPFIDFIYLRNYCSTPPVLLHIIIPYIQKILTHKD